ncbi:unnamed protein product, partial [Leptidea sinapis]
SRCKANFNSIHHAMRDFVRYSFV